MQLVVLGIKSKMRKKRKMLIFVNSFLPGFKGGGPITSIANLVDLISTNFDVCIVTRNHDVGESVPYEGVVFDEVTTFNGYNVVYLSKTNVVSIYKSIKNNNPDLLYSNSMFSSVTQMVVLLNKLVFHKKIIVAPRGELQEGALKIKKMKKWTYLFFYKFFKLHRNIAFHSTSLIETREISSRLDSKAIVELPNAVAVRKYQPLIKKENELRVVFISRISKKKNLDYALEVLSTVKHKVQFDIYGPKEDADYWKRCQTRIENMSENIDIRYKGSLRKESVTATMRKYHVFLLPTKSENFGHVIVEAMQSGLVPIISDQTPWLDLESKKVGWSINLSDKGKFVSVIEAMYIMGGGEYEELSQRGIDYVRNQLNADVLKNRYIDYFNNVIDIEVL